MDQLLYKVCDKQSRLPVEIVTVRTAATVRIRDWRLRLAEMGK